MIRFNGERARAGATGDDPAMAPELAEAIEAAAFEALTREYPRLIGSMRQRLRHGESPREIARVARTRGASPEQAAQIECAAAHLERIIAGVRAEQGARDVVRV